MTQVVLARLAQPDALALFHDNRNHDIEKLRAKTATLPAKLDLAADQYSDDIIDAQQFARVSTKLGPQLAALETQLRASSTAPDLHDLATPNIAEHWDALPLARKRKVIALLVEVTVDRVTQRSSTGQFDPNSVRITWRVT